jgi:hypothetical protein
MKLFLLALMVISFAPPFWFGRVRAPFWSALVWCAVLSAETVLGGWRSPSGRIFGSLVFGSVLAAVWCVPTYWIGRLF